MFDALSALDAQECGVDRIEICDNHFDGGTTPSVGVVAFLKDNLTIPLFPMVRPRGGDFLYAEEEIEIMKKDILSFKAFGCEGVVLGVLNKDGSVNRDCLFELVELAYPMEVTFHRAFDRTKNFEEAIETVYQSGCKRILTSGGYPTVYEGIQSLEKIKKLCEGKIKIVAGGGVDKNVVSKLLEASIEEIHTPARRMNVTEMNYLNPDMNENLQYSGIDKISLKEMVRIVKGS